MLLPCTLWGQADRTSPTGRIEFLPPEAASLMRYSVRGAGRTSPESPTSPAQQMPSPIGRS